MEKTRVLVTGAGGMLGQDVVRVLASDVSLEVHALFRARPVDVDGVSASRIELTDTRRLGDLLQQIQPRVIIHAAALVDLNQCEEQPDLARSVHVGVTQTLVKYAQRSSRVIYISTDSIFDGLKGNYSEEEAPSPVNVYGRTKLEGEHVTLESNVTNTVLRANIYGFHVPLGNSLAEWAIRELRQKKRISGFNDVFFNPLYTRHFAEIIHADFLKAERHGIWHLGCDEQLSKRDFLHRIARVFELDESLILEGNFSSSKLTVPRPKNTTLNTTKYRNAVRQTSDLHAGLKQFRFDIQQSDAFRSTGTKQVLL